MAKTATLALLPPFQATTVQNYIRRNQQFSSPPITYNASVFIPKVDAPHLPKTTDDKSIDEAINEAANNSTHSAPIC